MAILTMSAKPVSPCISPCAVARPESWMTCQSDFAATTIQSVARVYLAKKEWELLYVQHIENEVLRLKKEQKTRAKRAHKLQILNRRATTIQTLFRGYLVRKNYRDSDKILRGVPSGLSLMEAVRKRMVIQQRIESLKKQLSEVRQARNPCDDDREGRDEISVRKVEKLKATQLKLNIKAKTLEAVTRPLQEKFDGLRAEHEKLMKRYGKLESKNESRRYSNEKKAELLAKKRKQIQETRDELANSLSDQSIEATRKERSRAQHRLDTLVETSNTYASMGMNERDASAFSDEVKRIGREAHRKAKLFRDSLRSQMASNLTTSWNSSRSLMSGTVDTSAAMATPTSTTAVKGASMPKRSSDTSFPSTDGLRRGRGRISINNLVKERNSSSSSDSESSSEPKRQSPSTNDPRVMRKTKKNIVRREQSDRGHSPPRRKDSNSRSSGHRRSNSNSRSDRLRSNSNSRSNSRSNSKNRSVSLSKSPNNGVKRRLKSHRTDEEQRRPVDR